MLGELREDILAGCGVEMCRARSSLQSHRELREAAVRRPCRKCSELPGSRQLQRVG